MDAVCACLLELQMYALVLQVGFYNAGGLLCGESKACDAAWTHAKILENMKNEWSCILRMEASAAESKLLETHCSFCKWQVFREIHTVLQEEKYENTVRAREILKSWLPPFQGSCNVEDIFNAMQDSIKRSSKSDAGGLANLSCVGIRATSQKCKDGDGPLEVTLDPEDYEGGEVRGLKSSIWKPDSCPASCSDLYVKFWS